jgi:type VI secretion system Hcp family effector
MNTLRTFGLVTFALSACAWASAAAYIKIDGISGDVQERSHQGWIELSSVAGIKSPRDVATGQSSGRRQYEPIVIRKRIDKSSPMLAEALAKKKTLGTVVVSQDGERFTLSNVMVSSIQKDGNTESISFNYQKIEMQAAAAERPKTAPERATKMAPK